MNTAPQVKSEIARALDSTGIPGSANRITENQLRIWVIDYLNDRDLEIKKYPEEENASHWNLWLCDDATEKDVPFTVVLFGAAAMELLCGRDNGYAVRNFSERVSSDPVEILNAFRSEFQIAHDSVKVERELGEIWLGRSFGIRSK